MRTVTSNKTILPAGGGAYELPSLSVGVFLNDQPSHRLAHASSRARHLPLKKNEGWILPAGSTGFCEYDEELEFILISLDETILAEFGLDKNFEFGAIVGKLDPLLLSLCLSMPQIGETATLYRETMYRALAAQLVETIKPLPQWHIGIEDKRLKKVLDHIHDNLSTDLTLSEMANLAAMSPPHFSKMFKKTLGVSPLQYVIAARLDLASILLRTTKLTVAEICWRTGYQDLSRFGQHFKRKFGTTPAAFRKP
ncbi:MAG: AraC family transcriptional regulator [Cohaesibacter sp.]|jgi:AraC family transcriptional regulator|nr:AraC family transcriptional regulator [Cohaesibacter sp.]